MVREFKTVTEEISPAFGKDGGSLQVRAKIPDVNDGFATVNELVKFGYPKIKGPK